MKANLFALLLAATGPSEAATMAFVSKVDPMTDKASAFAVSRGDGNQVAVGCFGPGEPIEVVINSARWMNGGIGGTGEITVRFDRAPARILAGWQVVEPTVAELMDKNDVEEFARSMVRSRTLLVRADAVRLPDVDMAFDLTGSAEVMARVLDACRAPAKLRQRIFRTP